MFKKSVLIATVTSALLIGNAWAQSTRPSYIDPNEIINPNVEDYIWQEEAGRLPDYPQDENLHEFVVSDSDRRFHYYLDSESLSFDEDNVVRYTVVVRSNTGASNVAFEGLHCASSEYKLYAFGDGRGRFRPVRKPAWKPVVDRRHSRYRMELLNNYLCGPEVLNRSPEKIINAIKYDWDLSGGEGFR